MRPWLALTVAVGIASGSEGDWCWSIPADAGVVVNSPESPWLQQLRLGAYAHHHSAFVDGEAAGSDFWYGRGSDWRRMRATVQAWALGCLGFTVHANVVEDEGRKGGGVEFDYQGLFLAWAELDLKKLVPAVPLDTWSVGYGKRKLKELNEEMDTSINAILTVERSSFAAQLVPFRQATGTTGIWTSGSLGRHRFLVGLYTTDASREFGNWTDGTLLVGGWSMDFSKELGLDEALFTIGGGVQDVDGRDEVYSPWEWVITPWARLRGECWALRVSAAFGENEGPSNTTGGAFYGFTVMPSYQLVKDRLEAVMRYQFVGSEAPRGVQLTSRYVREAGLSANEGIPLLAAGRGDELQSLYGGLVWTICPKRLTVLAGLEWERLESRDREIYSGLTGWFSTRVIF
ncbi:hypothetical protein HAHE_26240 [Haloferula helveola]|uniref:Porin n=1 Tax=Haloferula helveola TaxID=490095 RepID=A0ABN6H511_9BACT|nr:hypothetical protein HAHE_26240 [Haloferula helveola]